MTTIEAHVVDKHVGARIRARRRELGVSQEQLAAAIGCSFQQIQKYENAKNRVSMSRLVAIAETLAVDPPYFFAGLPAPDVGKIDPANAPDAAYREGGEAALLLARVKDPERRQRILELVRAIAAARDLG
jgi:transcriptional regulator with XRE-family HTH domain